jgi:folate-binding protein YgfZ
MPDLALTRLDHLTILDARGADVRTFLQGQVSHDMTLLAGRGSLLAALNNPQGRVIAVLRLLHVASDHVLIVLPADLAEMVRQLLAKYVLRAKVTIAEPGGTWRVYGITGPDAGMAASTRLHMPMDATDWRQLIVAPRGEPLPEGHPADAASWRLADIEAGLPEVLVATSGNFVAQMLNLDLVDAISLTKGCYTGQEVVARAHYRGQVKRRAQRFYTESTAVLTPGERVRLSDGRNAQILMAAPAEGGGQQFLAVTQLATQADADEAGEGSGATAEALHCVQLPLPYPLPPASGGAEAGLVIA